MHPLDGKSSISLFSNVRAESREIAHRYAYAVVQTNCRWPSPRPHPLFALHFHHKKSSSAFNTCPTGLNTSALKIPLQAIKYIRSRVYLINQRITGKPWKVAWSGNERRARRCVCEYPSMHTCLCSRVICALCRMLPETWSIFYALFCGCWQVVRLRKRGVTAIFSSTLLFVRLIRGNNRLGSARNQKEIRTLCNPG